MMIHKMIVNKKRMFVIVAVALAVALTFGFAGSFATGANAETEKTPTVSSETEDGTEAASDGQAADDRVYGKEEVVYASLGGDGSAIEAYIVNIITSERAGEVTDYGIYSLVKNLTTEDEIIQGSDGKILFNAPVGDFYYQGNIETPKLPWFFNVTYSIDGREVSHEAASGKSGRLKIEIETWENTAVDSGWYENYLMQIAVTLDAALCRNIEAEGGTIANAGGSKQVNFSVMPGKNGSAVIEADVIDFTMDGIQFSAVPLEMSIDRPDTSEMTEDMEKLADAIVELDDGVRELKEGAEKIRNGATEYAGEMQTLLDGLSAMSAETEGLRAGANNIGSNLQMISQGLSGAQMPSEADIEGILNALRYSSDPVCQALAPQFEALFTQLAGIQDLAAGIQALSDGYNDPDPEKGFAAGLDAWLDGYDQIASNAPSISSGTWELRNGIAEFADGVGELKDGTAELKSETNDIPSMIEKKIDEMMDDYDKSDYQPLSFASDENGVINAVQFVITTEKIEKPEEPESDDEAENKTSLLDRLLDLFR